MSAVASIAASPIVCAIDQTAHATLEDLHRHLRKLKVRQDDYYTQWAPVRDRHTGQPIPFKAPVADYLRREFAGKVSLKGWLKAHPEEGREWSLNWLAARREEKELTYAPCQVELRSLLCPSMVYYENAFEGGYNAAAISAGYQTRFTGQWPNTVPALTCPVVIDTREQKPLELPVESVSGTLRSADYGLPPERDQLVYIERKSLSDLLGSLSERETRARDSNLARVTRELERATEIGAYVILLVEQKLSDCLAYNSIPYLRRQFSHVKVSPEHIFHNLRNLLHQFPHSFQPLFVDGRAEAARAVVQLLAAGDVVKTVDLQWALDSKRLALSAP